MRSATSLDIKSILANASKGDFGYDVSSLRAGQQDKFPDELTI